MTLHCTNYIYFLCMCTVVHSDCNETHNNSHSHNCNKVTLILMWFTLIVTSKILSKLRPDCGSFEQYGKEIQSTLCFLPKDLVFMAAQSSLRHSS
jgi:hypothetical protein